MAIERLAIFALSVSFTTSLILYPDLPPDIPPRAGRYGPFVGAPFVAFFLPTAAMALGWVLGGPLHQVWSVQGRSRRSSFVHFT